MGLDTKGRNFSAPRLTPGKGSTVFGSPEMLKRQERQISVLDSRARQKPDTSLQMDTGAKIVVVIFFMLIFSPLLFVIGSLIYYAATGQL